MFKFRKSMFSFAAVGLLSSMPSFGMDYNYISQEDAEEIANIEWSCQIEDVKGYVQQNNLEKVFLVMGVNSNESDVTLKDGGKIILEERFSKEYVFLDSYDNKKPKSNRDLMVNFNDLDQLKKLSTNLCGYFERIVLDDSTYKVTNWTSAHLTCFKNLLKTGGQFIFGPTLTICLQELPKNERVDWSEYYYKPYVSPLSDEQALEEVLKTARLDGDELCRAFLLPIHYIQTGPIRFDHEKKNNFKNFFMDAFVIPENYVRILSDVFGQGSVLVQHDAPLPFVSRYQDVQPVLITVTKRD